MIEGGMLALALVLVVLVVLVASIYAIRKLDQDHQVAPESTSDNVG